MTQAPPDRAHDAWEFAWRKVLYPLYESGVRRRGTLRYLAEYERQQWWTEEDLRALQWKKTLALLRHAQEHVPFHRERWQALGLDWRDLEAPEHFAQVPLLTKDDIRENHDRLVAAPFRGKTLRKSTGGSTGQPVHIEYTRESDERRQAVAMRGYAWAGARPGRKSAYLWGGDIGEVPAWKRAKKWLHQAVQRRRYLNSFHLGDSTMDAYVEILRRFDPDIVVAYTSPLHRLAQHCLAHGLKPIHPESVLTGAEPLPDFQRRDIEAAFGAPVFNTYGCREVMLIASECPEHDGLHANIDHLVVETVDAQGADAPEGRVVLTDLHNWGFPLIRYVNGDLASRMAGACTCGRGLPRLRSVDGRVADTLRTADGKVVAGIFFPHLMKDVPGVETFQVVQKSLTALEIAIVRREGFTPASPEFVEREVRKVFGEAIDVRFTFPDTIPLTASGKRRVAVSELDPAP